MPREFISLITAYDGGASSEDMHISHYDICWKEDGRFYKLQQPQIKLPLDIDALPRPEPIPMDCLYASWFDGITEAPSPLPDGCHIKTIPIQRYDPEYPELIPQMWKDEVNMLERLAKNPHPNLCPYYGCIRDGDYITGIALKKYTRDLQDTVVSKNERLDRRRIMADIKAGIDHLHGLGLVHNDLTAANVMLNENGRAILVDFGSTAEIGEKWLGGTPGWCRLVDTVTVDCDYFALGQMMLFFDTKMNHDPDFHPADAPITWTEDYLKPQVLIAGTPIGLENACEAFLAKLDSWSRVTFMVQDKARMEKTPCCEPFLSSGKAHIVEGDFRTREHYERAWSVAGAGIRSGDVDLVIYATHYDTESPDGLLGFKTEQKLILGAPMMHAWATSPTALEPWLVCANFPSGKSEYVSSLKELCWHRCQLPNSQHGEDEIFGALMKVLREPRPHWQDEATPEPPCNKATERSKCSSKIALVQMSSIPASTSETSASGLLQALADDTLDAWKGAWTGTRNTTRNVPEYSPGMWLDMDECSH